MRKAAAFILAASIATAGLSTPAGAVTSSRPPGGATAAGQPAPAWPKTVDEFLAGEYLRRSDVVLTKRDWNLTSWLIRSATTSPFSHAALVFTQPQEDPGVTSTFVIEAGTGGVDLTNLKDYLADKSSFLAIKRLRTNWFDAPKQSRVRGLLLDSIKAEYNYWAIVRIVRNIWFGIKKTVQGQEKTVDNFRDNDWKRPNEFICSGLVQVGFVEAISEFILRRQLPPWALNEVVFNPNAATRLPDREAWQGAPDSLIDEVIPAFRRQLATELEAVTPEDLAVSPNLEWQFVVRDGLVHRVSSYDEVVKLIR